MFMYCLQLIQNQLTADAQLMYLTIKTVWHSKLQFNTYLVNMTWLVHNHNF